MNLDQAIKKQWKADEGKAGNWAEVVDGDDDEVERTIGEEENTGLWVGDDNNPPIRLTLVSALNLLKMALKTCHFKITKGGIKCYAWNTMLIKHCSQDLS